jgi:predicted Zn-dependent protease
MLKSLLLIAMTSQLVTPCFCLADNETWRNRVSAEEVITTADIVAEVTFGRAIAARILGKYPASDNPTLLKYINLVGNTLLLNDNRPELEFHFMILDTDDVATYAAPGGYVFISKGSLELMEDEAELATVLAHEIALVLSRDIVSTLKIKGADDVSTLAMLIGGSSGSGAVRAALQPGDTSAASRSTFHDSIRRGLDLIYMDEYTINEVLQADRTAVLTSILSGYDPAGLVRYLERLRQKSSNLSVTSVTTHMSFDLRISHIREVIVSEGATYLALAKNRARFTETIRDSKNPDPIPNLR